MGQPFNDHNLFQFFRLQLSYRQQLVSCIHEKPSRRHDDPASIQRCGHSIVPCGFRVSAVSLPVLESHYLLVTKTVLV